MHGVWKTFSVISGFHILNVFIFPCYDDFMYTLSATSSLHACMGSIDIIKALQLAIES